MAYSFISPLLYSGDSNAAVSKLREIYNLPSTPEEENVDEEDEDERDFRYTGSKSKGGEKRAK